MKIIPWLKDLLKKKPTKNLDNTGAIGESLAVDFLITLGYKILTTNYHSKYGEIDIIASDKNYLVFVEVKYRKNAQSFGGAKAAVNWQKQKKIIKTAQLFLAQKFKNKSDQPNSRFDVIAIDGEMNANNIVHYIKAFKKK